MKAFNTHFFSEQSRMARSKMLVGGVVSYAADTYSLIRLPAKAFVTDVWLHVVVAADQDDVTVGYIEGTTEETAGFLSADIAEADVIGLKRAIHDTEVAFAGRYFDKAGSVTITLPTALGSGKLQVFAQFYVIC